MFVLRLKFVLDGPFVFVYNDVCVNLKLPTLVVCSAKARKLIRESATIVGIKLSHFDSSNFVYIDKTIIPTATVCFVVICRRWLFEFVDAARLATSGLACLLHGALRLYL